MRTLSISPAAVFGYSVCLVLCVLGGLMAGLALRNPDIDVFFQTFQQSIRVPPREPPLVARSTPTAQVRSPATDSIPATGESGIYPGSTGTTPHAQASGSGSGGVQGSPAALPTPLPTSSPAATSTPTYPVNTPPPPPPRINACVILKSARTGSTWLGALLEHNYPELVAIPEPMNDFIDGGHSLADQLAHLEGILNGSDTRDIFRGRKHKGVDVPRAVVVTLDIWRATPVFRKDGSVAYRTQLFTTPEGKEKLTRLLKRMGAKVILLRRVNAVKYAVSLQRALTLSKACGDWNVREWVRGEKKHKAPRGRHNGTLVVGSGTVLNGTAVTVNGTEMEMDDDDGEGGGVMGQADATDAAIQINEDLENDDKEGPFNPSESTPATDSDCDDRGRSGSSLPSSGGGGDSRCSGSTGDSGAPGAPGRGRRLLLDQRAALRRISTILF
eukprot:jgi/Mesvir1/20421/Mv12324-RA.1